MDVSLSPGDIVLDGDPAPFPKRGRSPGAQFSAHVYCGQTAGWIKMALGMEVDVGPGHFVLDGDPASTPKGADPQFSAHVYCGQTTAWIKMPLGTEVGFGLCDIVFDVDLATPRKKGTPTQPNFWPMSTVAAMSIVATVAQLSYC